MVMDQHIEIWESLVLLLLYACYVGVMNYDQTLEVFLANKVCRLFR